jgi:hypothetical protein
MVACAVLTIMTRDSCCSHSQLAVAPLLRKRLAPGARAWGSTQQRHRYSKTLPTCYKVGLLVVLLYAVYDTCHIACCQWRFLAGLLSYLLVLLPPGVAKAVRKSCRGHNGMPCGPYKAMMSSLHEHA